MRHDKTHETEQARKAHRRTCEQRRHGEHAQAHRAHVHAHTLRHSVSREHDIECARTKQGDNEAHDDARRRPHEVHHAHARQTAHKERTRAHVGVGVHDEHGVHARAEHRCGRHAHEHDSHARPVGDRGHREHEKCRKQRAAKRSRRQGCGDIGQKGAGQEHRQARAGVDAEHVWAGQGVVEHRLRDAARHRQGGAGQHSRKHARQAHMLHDVGRRGGGGLPARQNGEHIGQRDVRRAEHDRGKRGNKAERSRNGKRNAAPPLGCMRTIRARSRRGRTGGDTRAQPRACRRSPAASARRGHARELPFLMRRHRRRRGSSPSCGTSRPTPQAACTGKARGQA